MFRKIQICLNLINILALGYVLPLDLAQTVTYQNFESFSSNNAIFLKDTPKKENVYYSPLSLEIGNMINELKECYSYVSRDLPKNLQCEHVKNTAIMLNSALKTFANDRHVTCKVSTIVVTLTDEQFESLKNTFLMDAKNYYKIEIIKAQNKPTDSLYEEINKWVSAKSQNRHPRISPDTESAQFTGMQLSILSFKSYWNTPKIIRLEKKKFTTEEGVEIYVNVFTYEEKIAYHDFTDLKIQAISLPYKGKEFSVVVILPYKDEGLDALSSFTGKDYKSVFSELKHADLSLVNYEIPLLNSTNITFTNLGTILNEVNTFDNIPDSIVYDETFKINFHVNRPYAVFMYHEETFEILFSVFIRDPGLDAFYNRK